MFLIILLTLLALLIYIFNKKQFRYWKEHGIPQLNPSFIVGDIKDLLLQKKQVGMFFESAYHKTKEYPLFGLYFSYRPIILINDQELAKTILTKDFQYFHDRGFFIDTNIDPLTANLFCLPGEKWKRMRQKTTPLFSASKLKSMLPIIQENFKLFENAVDQLLLNDSECVIDIRDFSSKIGLSLISSIAYGLQNDCFSDPENIFRLRTLKVLEPTFTANFRFTSALFLPKLCEKFRMGFFAKEVNEFYLDLTKRVVEYREKYNIECGDFLDLFLKLRDNDFLKNNENDDSFTINDVAAHSFIFVLAGYETTTATISYCLHELAKHPEALKKVEMEINDLVDEEFSYKKIQKLKYLDNCLNETLRKYPVIPFLNRVCRNDYQVPGTSYIIPKDTPLIIPTMAYQYDPDFWPNPKEFIPERFDQTFEFPLLSFGYGNRACIGKRMALIVAKCYIYDILSKYKIDLVSPKRDIKFSAKIPSLTPSDKLLIKISRR